jgi:hypothetical protein
VLGNGKSVFKKIIIPACVRILKDKEYKNILVIGSEDLLSGTIDSTRYHKRE